MLIGSIISKTDFAHAGTIGEVNGKGTYSESEFHLNMISSSTVSELHMGSLFP